MAPENETEELMPETSEPVKPKAKTTRKTIYVKPTLTEAEERLILEPDTKDEGRRIIPAKVAARAGKKSHPVRNLFLTLLILAAAAYGSYYIGGWDYVKERLGSKTAQAPELTATQQADNTQQSSPLPTSTPSASVPYASSTPSAASSTPTQAGKTLTVKNTETGYLNVRKNSSTGSELITQIKPGETYSYTEAKSGWYKIVLPGGEVGWVSGTYVTVNN